MESAVFTQLSLVIVIVVIVSFIMRLLRQPLVMGYILTGVIVGPSFLHIIRNQAAFTSFSTIGITLLLLIVGLGLNAGVIRSLGRVSVITCLTVMPLLGSAAFLVSRALGFNMNASLVIGVSMLFSSTIILLTRSTV